MNISYKTVITDWLNGIEIKNYEEKIEYGVIKIKHYNHWLDKFNSSIKIWLNHEARKWNNRKTKRNIILRLRRTGIDPILKFRWFYLSIILMEDPKHIFINEFLELLENRSFQLEDNYHSKRNRKYGYNGYTLTIEIIDKLKPPHLLIHQWADNSNRLTQNCKNIVIQNSFYDWDRMKLHSPTNKNIIWIYNAEIIYTNIFEYLLPNNNYIIYIKSSYTYVNESYFDTDKYELMFKEFAAINDIHNLYYIPHNKIPIDLTNRIYKYREDVKLSQVLMKPNNPLIHHKLSFPLLLDYIYKFLDDKK